MSMLRSFSALLVCLLLVSHARADEKRIALLIGNQDYPAEVGALTNTHKDVRTMEEALAAVGFETLPRFDLDEDGMEDAFDKFEARIGEEADAGHEVIAFFYYSGHGAAAYDDREARNYLIPAKETITAASHIFRKGVELEEVLASLQASRAKAVFVVSDACRNELKFAFSKSIADKGMTRVSQRPGMLVAFATAAGETTPDDGLFADTLAEEIRRPGQDAVVAFYQALAEVSDKRKSSSRPFMAPGKLPRGLCFAGCTAGPAAPAQPEEPTRKAEYWFEQEDEFSFLQENVVLKATVNGLEYTIHEFGYGAPTVELLKDFNADGTLDAIVSVHGGGNCCPAEYFFVADMGSGHFLVSKIEDIYAWDPPTAELHEGRWVAKFISSNEGMNTDDFKQDVHLYALKADKPELVLKTFKREVTALVELRSSMFGLDTDDAAATQSISFDMDDDGTADTLTCGFWSRWGRLSDCKVTLATEPAPIPVDTACKRLGIVNAQQNGLSLLVCDSDNVHAFNAASNAYLPVEN
ncbi:caspase family protein [Hyphomonas sp. UBA4494]|jgi:hypothetical protein|uniref:caspase family protein n=1 Tax=Hyphomonas sp. UBA4494 TaxID=1946631 RepID=UPI0025BAF0E2|nr:caspase family protein [Hyphomonas sp. UBA4494]